MRSPAPISRRRRRAVPPAARAAALVVVVLATLSLANGAWKLGPGGAPGHATSGREGDRPGGGPPPPNVLLVTLCSVRADHLGAYGYPGNTSPNIDALAAEGVVFERAWANATFTLPSHASMLTGLLPGHVGVTASTDTLGPAWPTLPEILGAYGYRTFAHAPVASRASFRSGDGLERGFDRFIEGESGREADSADALLDALSEGRSPFFALVHYKDAHPPYLSGRRGRPGESAVDPRIEKWSTMSVPRPPAGAPGDPDVWMVDQMKADPALHDEVVRLYDGAVHAADARVGVLLAGLADRGLLDQTLVVIAGDHGQALGESDHIGHQGHLQPEVLHVPLVVRLPGNASGGTRVTGDVSLVDLVPTLLGFAGAALPARLDGHDLRPHMSGVATAPAPAIAQADVWVGGTSSWREVVVQGPLWLEWRGSDTAWTLRRASAEGWDAGWTEVGEGVGAQADVQAEAAPLLEARARISAGQSRTGPAPTATPAEREALQRDGYW